MYIYFILGNCLGILWDGNGVEVVFGGEERGQKTAYSQGESNPLFTSPRQEGGSRIALSFLSPSSYRILLCQSNRSRFGNSPIFWMHMGQHTYLQTTRWAQISPMI